MIELINFSKHYGDLVAVNCLNLKIQPGEMFGFIGPNGAGKSTTIRFLSTLLKATAGDGIVNGHRVSKDPMGVRRSIGYMPDNFGVYDGMRVWEFLDFFALAYQIPRPRRKQVIGDVLDLLDLSVKRESYVNSLSRGMKQRLCLAKTLVHDPPVLILDEPTSGLDPRARIEIKALFKELRQMGKTILISSHILTELADCCTSIGIIERGRLLMSGPMEEVYKHIRRNRIVKDTFFDEHGNGHIDHPQHARNPRRADRKSHRHRGIGRRRPASGRFAGKAGGGGRAHALIRRQRTLAGRCFYDGHQRCSGISGRLTVGSGRCVMDNGS